MQVNIVFSVSIYLLVMTTIACSPARNRNKETPKSVSAAPRPLYLGDLDAKMGEIYSNENEVNFDHCDLKNRTRIFEVARVLEEKRLEIENFIRSSPASPDQQYADFGKIKFIDDISNKVGENIWSSYSRSWTDVFSYYDQIKTWPVDENWVNLNNFARGFVLNDDERIVNLGFGGLSRDAGPKLDAIQTKVQDCIAEESCIDPKLDTTQKTFLNINLLFNYYNQSLADQSVSISDKRNILTRFLRRIKRENSIYEFHVNPTAKLEGNTLVIPMDLSVLGAASTRFVEIIEKVWNVDGGKNIKIESKIRPTASYLLQVDEILGGRAFVQHAEEYMQLFNFGRLKSATHEFGHVIGLTDEYYTTWDSSKCSYVDESNSGNLMSDSYNGKVLPEHWQSIKKIYWKQ